MSMTEQEWLDCALFPKKMLQFLGKTVSKRKLRLFACACCRRLWDLLSDLRTQAVVETAERFADGLVRRQELVSVRNNSKPYADALMQTDPHSPPLWAAVAAAITAQRSAFHAACNASECAPQCSATSGASGGMGPHYLWESVRRNRSLRPPGFGGEARPVQACPRHLRQPLPPRVHQPHLADAGCGQVCPNCLRRPPVCGLAREGGRPGRSGLHQRRHPDPL